MKLLTASLLSLLVLSNTSQVSAAAPVAITPCNTNVCEDKFDDFERLAKSGNGQAQMVLAGMYYSGYGVDRSVKQSLRWYKKAAKFGSHSFASYRAGLIYLFDDSIEQNVDKGIHYLVKAAENGHADAAYQLADVYLKGLLVESDMQEVEKWLQVGEELGHAKSIFRLGLAYESGLFGEKQTDKAIALYQEAANKNIRRAHERLVMLGQAEPTDNLITDDANNNIEVVTVKGPELVDLLDISLAAIKERQYHLSNRQNLAEYNYYEGMHNMPNHAHF